MSEDYKQGFKDGFAAGLEEGKKLANKSYNDGYADGMRKTMPPPYVPPVTSPSYYPPFWYSPNIGIAYAQDTMTTDDIGYNASNLLVDADDSKNLSLGTYADWAGNPTNNASDK